MIMRKTWRHGVVVGLSALDVMMNDIEAHLNDARLSSNYRTITVDTPSDVASETATFSRTRHMFPLSTFPGGDDCVAFMLLPRLHCSAHLVVIRSMDFDKTLCSRKHIAILALGLQFHYA